MVKQLSSLQSPQRSSGLQPPKSNSTPDRVSTDCYAVRGIAIFLVVVSHVLGSNQAGVLQMYPATLASTTVLDALNHFLYSFHVPLFLIVSGFASVLLSNSSQASLRQFLLARWWRLVVPLLCWAPLSYLLRSGLRQVSYSWLDVLTGSIFQPFFIFWFFHALLFASIAAFLCLRITRSPVLYLLLSAGLALVAVGLNSLYPGGIWSACQFYLYWNVFYALGVFGAAHHLRVSGISPRRALVACLLAGLGMVAAQLLIPDPYFMVTRLINGTIAFTCLCLLLNAFRDRWGRLLAPVQYLGQLSMVIYLFHVYFGVAARQGLGLVLGFSEAVLPVHLILGCAVSLWGPVLLYRLLKSNTAFALSIGAGK